MMQYFKFFLQQHHTTQLLGHPVNSKSNLNYNTFGLIIRGIEDARGDINVLKTNFLPKIDRCFNLFSCLICGLCVGTT